MESKKNLGLATVTGSYVLWGFLAIFWSFLAPVSSVYVLAQRIVWSLVCMAIYLFVTKGYGEIRRAVKDRQTMGLSAVCGVLITLNWGTYIYAVNSGHVLDASMGYFIEPVLVALMGLIAFREKPTMGEKITFCFAAAGIVYLLVRTGSLPVLALAVSVPFSVYGAVKKNLRLSGQASLFMETLMVAPWALLFIAFWLHRAGGSEVVMNGASFWLLPASGLVTSVPLLLYNIGIKEIPYYFSGILMYVNPTLQFLVGLIYFHEALDPDRLIAFVIIWVGIAVTLGEKITMIRREKRLAKA
jgi:chloramphenicol-sensitive protein RarD